uniref:Tudor domain-containing protein n=1 Tax=Knipowitschia caucasica TaxID=637954 RepID=A0AAV2KF85_KNICA
MMKKLSEHFNKVALDEDVLENPEPGMLCCAVFEEDMHFYRGVVVDILQHGAEVLFIDFGNLAKVPHNLIKKIPKEFSGTSAFALCCSLDSVVPTDEFWTSSSTNAFRNLSSNKILQVQVIQMRKNKLDVELYYEKSGNDGGQRLSELLISKNHAHYRSDDEENVIQLENSMNSEVFKESLLPCTDIALKVGDLVLATYEEDEALYRAVVKEIVDPCAFLVVFVDFGNSATVSKEKLFMMKKDNITQPRYSVQCCLHDHSAFDSSTAFANAVMDRSLMFEFVCYKNSQWEVNVETFDAVTSVPDDAVDKMETNTVEPAASKEIRVRAKKETTIEVPEDLFKAFLPPKIQRGDTETGQVLSSQRNGEFYFRPDKSRDALAALETLIAVHLGIVMDRSLGQNFPNEEKQTELVFTQEHAPGLDLPQNLAFAPVELNKEYSGFAAAITSPCEFCLVLDDFDLISQVSILLDDLPNDLQPLPQSHLVPRTGCLVNSQSRNKWCRAEILHADSTLTLNLVDYGHAECLHFGEKSKLRKLPESITALPKVTYPCVLNAVRPTGEGQEWSDEATIFFQQCLDQRNLQIFFREVMSDQQWKVDVLTDGGHVAMQLVDAGHASYTDPMLGLRFQEKGLPGQWNLSDDEEDDEDPDDVHQMFEETEEIFKVKSDSNLCTTM